jgi:hypothetical protein
VASIFWTASAQSFEAVDLLASRHAAIGPWPGTIFPQTPVISALQALIAFFRSCSEFCTLDIPSIPPYTEARPFDTNSAAENSRSTLVRNWIPNLNR